MRKGVIALLVFFVAGAAVAEEKKQAETKVEFPEGKTMRVLFKVDGTNVPAYMKLTNGDYADVYVTTGKDIPSYFDEDGEARNFFEEIARTEHTPVFKDKAGKYLPLPKKNDDGKSYTEEDSLIQPVCWRRWGYGYRGYYVRRSYYGYGYNNCARPYYPAYRPVCAQPYYYNSGSYGYYGNVGVYGGAYVGGSCGGYYGGYVVTGWGYGY